MSIPLSIQSSMLASSFLNLQSYIFNKNITVGKLQVEPDPVNQQLGTPMNQTAQCGFTGLSTVNKNFMITLDILFRGSI